MKEDFRLFSYINLSLHSLHVYRLQIHRIKPIVNRIYLIL